ncbi:MAG: hypothetical protein CMJ18_01755 [Phycisphaeraceae bacterium]|nr:hypothetical protein [Phycisphaeraceae bacterium]
MIIGRSRPSTDSARSGQLPGRLAHLSLPRQVLALSVWPLLEQLMSFMVGVVDLALAGHLQPADTAVAAADAIGVGGFFSWLMMIIQSAVGIGATALIARAVGGRHRGLAHAALAQSMLLALAVGAALAAAMFLTASTLATVTGLKGLGQSWCAIYLRILAAAAPFSALLLIGNAALRGAGDTRTPFAVMVVVNVVNIAVSALLVYGPEPFGGHGVRGIASGTVIAWFIGAILILARLMRRGGVIRLHWHRLRPHWHTLRRIVRVGLPNMFESVVGMWFGNFVVVMIVGRIADQAVLGAHQTVIRIEAVSFLPGFAMGIAASTLVGQYLGMGDAVRARRAANLCWLYGAAIMVAMGILFMAVPHWLVGLITTAEPLLELAPTPLRICGPFQIFLATQIVLAGALRGAGDTRATMWMTLVSMFLVRVPAAWLLAIPAGLGLNGIWIAMGIEMFVRAALFAWRFMSNRWAEVRV